MYNIRFLRALAAMGRRSRAGQKARRRGFLELETLERRTLLSMVIANGGRIATYTDVDGDRVAVTVSLGTLTADLFTTAAAGAGEQLQTIFLAGGGFVGTNLTVTVTRVAGGNGLANIGFINSDNKDLGNVTVPGDLGRIVAGDYTMATPGLGVLAVRSLGQMGLDTQGGTGNLVSIVNGNLRGLVVKCDIKGALLQVTGAIGSATIGGSLIGGSADHDGRIMVLGALGPVKIGGDIMGGGGANAGHIDAGTLASLTVNGSIIGGAGTGAGVVYAGTAGAVKIGRDLRGGAGTYSGGIQVIQSLSNLTIGGSVVGSSAEWTGRVAVSGNLGPVKIGGDVRGGSGADSGTIWTNANLTSLTVAGACLGGVGEYSGGVSVNGNAGAIKIGGDVRGGDGDRSGRFSISGTLASLAAGGALVGGLGDYSGSIICTNAGALRIGGDMRGDAGEAGGMISVTGTLSGLTVGGSLVG
jgi:hypothetical protein